MGMIVGVRTNVPTAIRALRRAREWRQADLGAQATLSRDVVSRVENGELAGLTIGSLELLAGALEATLVVELRWQRTWIGWWTAHMRSSWRRWSLACASAAGSPMSR